MAKMSDSVEVRCLRCGAPDAGERARCVCGASLLMDVVLKGAVADERQRFGLARALALLGPPAPSFSEARVVLAIPGNRVVRGVSSAFAQKLLAVLSAHGADAYLQPSELPEATPGAHREPPSPRRSASWCWAALRSAPGRPARPRFDSSPAGTRATPRRRP